MGGGGVGQNQKKIIPRKKIRKKIFPGIVQKNNSYLGRQAYKFHLKKIYFQPSSEKKNIFLLYRCTKKNIAS
jgi:hypothetical protein